MLRVTETVIKDNNIIGYQLFDGSDRFMVTEMQLWRTAQNQFIENIETAGTIEKPIIKSAKGFDLSTLPQVDYNDI